MTAPKPRLLALAHFPMATVPEEGAYFAVVSLCETCGATVLRVDLDEHRAMHAAQRRGGRA